MRVVCRWCHICRRRTDQELDREGARDGLAVLEFYCSRCGSWHRSYAELEGVPDYYEEHYEEQEAAEAEALPF